MTNKTQRFWQDAERDPVHAAATDWFVRLQDPGVLLEETLEWQRWMSSDARHAEAFARIEEVWQGFSATSRPSAPTTLQQLFDTYDGSTPVSDWRERGRRLPILGLAASIVAVALIAGIWTLLNQATVTSSGAVQALSTQVGEKRTITLADGSRLVMGGDTEVDVHLGNKERRIELARGEAFFSVAKDVSRPFVVHAGDATVTAIGTEFNVRRGTERVVVAVVEGRVKVAPEPTQLTTRLLQFSGLAPKSEPVQVDAGEQTTVTRESSGAPAAVPLPDPANAMAWQSGRLAFQSEPLRFVLEDVNRYAAKQIVIADAGVGELLITGTVMSDNVTGWLSSLESAFELRAVEEADRIVIERRE